MSGLQHIERSVKDAFISGEPGTTGREPFENSTASGPGQQFASSGTGAGIGHDHSHAGHHHTSGESTGQKVRDELTGGSGLSHGQTTGTGLTGNQHDHSHTSHSSSGQHGLGGGGLTGAAGGAVAAVGSGVGHRDHGDRVGNVGQDSARYEGDLHSGPRTSGAAGTDRFDSDNHHRGTGLTGSHDGQYADGVHQDTSQRAPGQSSGGLSGLLATSDKDFTGRDRKGEGAYADTDGKFKLNETGPGGNTALTGREGNLHNNPVAQAKSHVDGSHSTTGATGATGAHGSHDTTTGAPHKEGLVEKVKHAVGL